MGTEETGLTLEGLAQRLELLERENGRMRSENAALRDEVATLRESPKRRGELFALGSSGTRPDEEPASEPAASGGRVSRKWLLSKAGAAAVGGVAAGALMLRNPREAKAHDVGSDLIKAHAVFSHYLDVDNHIDSTAAITGLSFSNIQGAIHGENRSSGPGVLGKSANSGVKGIATDLSGVGVEGATEGSNGTGVKGIGRYGVWGESDQAGFYGVTGRNTRTDGTGVRGVGAKRGVLGESTNSTGVEGRGKNGVLGESSTEGQNGVWGRHTNKGAGVSGEGRVGVIGFSHENGWNAVWGRHTANGRGVAGDSAQGTGVWGESTGGYGGQFKGGKAQLRLVPGSVAGKPTSGTHTKGEIYMDSKGTLFVCTAGDGTTVGTWKKVNMKLV